MGRRIFFLYAIQFPKLLRCRSRLLAEDRDEVADIAVAAEIGDAVERSVGSADEEFFGAADAQNRNVRADGAADKTLEQAGQILRRNVELLGEIIDIKRVRKMTFDFLHCRADILKIERVLRLGKSGGKLGKTRQKLKALNRESGVIHFIVLKMGDDHAVDPFLKPGTVRGRDKKIRRDSADFIEILREFAVKCQKRRIPQPVSAVFPVFMRHMRRDQNPVSGFQGNLLPSKGKHSFPAFRLNPVVQRKAVRADDRLLQPVVADAVGGKRKIGGRWFKENIVVNIYYLFCI